jgi:hypothetical protein
MQIASILRDESWNAENSFALKCYSCPRQILSPMS